VPRPAASEAAWDGRHLALTPRRAVVTLRVLTKSAQVEQLLDLHHEGLTVLPWSLNPPEVPRASEYCVLAVAERVEAMGRCAMAS